jgi:hypothetical protein
MGNLQAAAAAAAAAALRQQQGIAAHTLHADKSFRQYWGERNSSGSNRQQLTPTNQNQHAHHTMPGPFPPTNLQPR